MKHRLPPAAEPASEAKPSGRKPYATPQLTEYGRIADLTRAVDFQGMADGGTKVFMRKT
jgi:hypothetical protein